MSARKRHSPDLHRLALALLFACAAPRASWPRAPSPRGTTPDPAERLFKAAEAAEQQGHPDWALRIWKKLALRYPKSAWWDDALWRSAQVLRTKRQFHEAIRTLGRIVATRRHIWFVASTDSQFLDDALWQIGLIYLDDFGDIPHAQYAFSDLIDDLPHSRLADDAQFQLARIAARTGDRKEACAALLTLARRFPDSNQRRAAERFGAELSCRLNEP